MKQTSMFPKSEKTYGGQLLNKATSRQHGRPISTRHTIHMVLRSSKAKGKWSFRQLQNADAIGDIINKFANKYGVRVMALANVGNHLHLHIRLSSRHTYNKFVRAISSAISMKITGASRWNPHKRTVNTNRISKEDRFWDYRPFTRIIGSFRELQVISDYMRINQFEGLGFRRDSARKIVKLWPVSLSTA